MAAATDTRLAHLAHAAQAVAETSPTVAAALNREHNRLADLRGVDLPPAWRLTVCGACGSLLGDASQQKGKSEVAVYVCGRCSRRTYDSRKQVETPSMPRQTLGRRAEAAVRDAPQSGRMSPGRIVKPAGTGDKGLGISANASSKQRAKARKKGGLKALVEKSRAEAQGEVELGLMDFMEKG